MPAFADNQSYLDQTFANLTLDAPKLSGAEFESCVFDGCNFSESILYACRFSNCLFTGCDLGLVKVPNCRFTEVEFKQSKLIGVDWTTIGASKTDLIMFSVSFNACVLDFASFYGLRLSGTTLRDCSAKEVDFSETDLSQADCRNSDFEGARFIHSNLEKANFTGARNYAIDPLQNRIKRARFSLPDAVSLLSVFEVIVE